MNQTAIQKLFRFLGIDAADEAVAAAHREPIVVDGAGGGAGTAWAAPAAVGKPTVRPGVARSAKQRLPKCGQKCGQTPPREQPLTAFFAPLVALVQYS